MNTDYGGGGGIVGAKSVKKLEMELLNEVFRYLFNSQAKPSQFCLDNAWLYLEE